MNKVINGKMYDTKKAETIKIYKESLFIEDKDIEKGEILYKKSNGEYFKEVIDYTLYS